MINLNKWLSPATEVGRQGRKNKTESQYIYKARASSNSDKKNLV